MHVFFLKSTHLLSTTPLLWSPGMKRLTPGRPSCRGDMRSSEATANVSGVTGVTLNLWICFTVWRIGEDHFFGKAFQEFQDRKTDPTDGLMVFFNSESDWILLWLLSEFYPLICNDPTARTAWLSLNHPGCPGGAIADLDITPSPTRDH